MTKFVASLIVAGTLIASLGVAQAAPLGGEAARTAASLGFLTVGGSSDAR